jgi:protein gp37
MLLLERSWRKFFISAEPMLEPINIMPYATQIDWVICGGESGNKARFFSEDWAWELIKQCATVNVPFFFKQTGKNHDFTDSERLAGWERTRRFPAWHPKGTVTQESEAGE